MVEEMVNDDFPPPPAEAIVTILKTPKVKRKAPLPPICIPTPPSSEEGINQKMEPSELSKSYPSLPSLPPTPQPECAWMQLAFKLKEKAENLRENSIVEKIKKEKIKFSICLSILLLITLGLVFT